MLKKIIMLSFVLMFGLAVSSCDKKAGDKPEENGQGQEQDAVSDSTSAIPEKPEKVKDLMDAAEPEGGYAQFSEIADGEEIAVITTDFGIIRFRFFPQYTPIACTNFITQAKLGTYDGVDFHRIINGFMIQGGGSGDCIWGGYFTEVEATPQLHHIRGAVAMARTSGSPPTMTNQFYIVQNKGLDANSRMNMQEMKENQNADVGRDETGRDLTVRDFFPEAFCDCYLKYGGTPFLNIGMEQQGVGYTVFGQVIEGMDVVDKIADVATGANDKPIEAVIIESIRIEKYQK